MIRRLSIGAAVALAVAVLGAAAVLAVAAATAVALEAAASNETNRRSPPSSGAPAVRGSASPRLHRLPVVVAEGERAVPSFTGRCPAASPAAAAAVRVSPPSRVCRRSGRHPGRSAGLFLGRVVYPRGGQAELRLALAAEGLGRGPVARAAAAGPAGGAQRAAGAPGGQALDPAPLTAPGGLERAQDHPQQAPRAAPTTTPTERPPVASHDPNPADRTRDRTADRTGDRTGKPYNTRNDCRPRLTERAKAPSVAASVAAPAARSRAPTVPDRVAIRTQCLARGAVKPLRHKGVRDPTGYFQWDNPLTRGAIP